MKKAFCILSISFFLSAIKAQTYGWSELGGDDGLRNAAILSLCKDGTGNFYAAGGFYVAKFNGTTWGELGGSNSLNPNSATRCICSDNSGNIYAAGDFGNDSTYSYVAKFNGTTWSELGGLNGLKTNGNIVSIISDAAGNIYAAGGFRNDSGKCYVAKYNGSTWSELGGLNSLAANGSVYSLCIDRTGNIYAAGNFTNDSSNFYVAKYDGAAWSEVGGLNGLAANSFINSICVDSMENIYAAGRFSNISGNRFVAKYNGATWSETGGLNGLSWLCATSLINSVCTDKAGSIYATGAFTNCSGYTYVAKFDGVAWSRLGGSNGWVAIDPIYVVYSDILGNIYAAGDFITNTSGEYFVAKYGVTTDIAAINLANSLTIFPNPTSNTVTISTGNIATKATIKLLDITGQTHIEKTWQSGSQFVLDISNESPGIYFIELRQEENTWIGKVVKSN